MNHAKLKTNHRAATIIRIVVLACVAAVSATASGQVPTTLQLPTFSSFSANTSVAAPDRGSILLGGVQQYSEGSLSRGVPVASHVPAASRLFKNRAVGREVGQSTAHVSVWIHDLRAMDEALLAEARSGHVANDQAANALPANSLPANSLPANVLPAKQRSANDRDVARVGDGSGVVTRGDENSVVVDSVAAIRLQRALEVDQAETEARELLRQGDQAREDGKPGVARIYYQMAARRSPKTLGPEVQARLRRLSVPLSR